MAKSDTIEAIVSLNPTARPDFLAEFSNADLHDYLHRLTFAPEKSGSVDPSRSRRSVRLEQRQQASEMRR